MTPEELASIARELETNNPIDWDQLAISEEAAYLMMASQVMTLFSGQSNEVLLATITKLIVENFVLNLKLLTQ